MSKIVKSMLIKTLRLYKRPLLEKNSLYLGNHPYMFYPLESFPVPKKNSLVDRGRVDRTMAISTYRRYQDYVWSLN